MTLLSRSFVGLLSLSLVLASVSLAHAKCLKQKEHVKYLKSVFARVMYEFHMTSPGHFDPNARPTITITDIDETYSVIFIDLDNTKITDETLERLRNLPTLEYVHISNTKITNDGIRHLKNLKKIRVLTLNNEGIDDRALKHIGELRSLEELFIDNAEITDEGLLSLHSLKNLKKLLLTDPAASDDDGAARITPHGLQKLRYALPNSEIILL